MKEDVGMSKPKKHANKVRWDPKFNKPLLYNPTYVFLFIYFLFQCSLDRKRSISKGILVFSNTLYNKINKGKKKTIKKLQ